MDRGQYQRFAEIDDCHWWFKGRRHVVQLLLDSIWSHDDSDRRILDIGTGSGGMLPVLAAYGKVTASEPDPETFAFVRNRYDHLCEFVCGGWESLQLPDKSFDLITAFDVLEHCEDDSFALVKWRQWLKDDGIMMLTVPAFNCLWGRNDEISHHYRRYTKATLSEALKSADFKLQKISYINASMFAPVWVSRNIKERIDNVFAGNRPLTPWDFGLPPAPLNSLLTGLFKWENSWVKSTGLPWGTSLIAIARPMIGSVRAQ